MKVKGILSEEKVTLPELRAVLLGVESERIAAEKEMSYEFRRCMEHANQLAKTTPEKSKELVDKLLKLEKMKPRSRTASPISCRKAGMRCGRSLQKSGTRSIRQRSILLST